MDEHLLTRDRKRVLLLFAGYDPLQHKGIMRFAREANWIVFSGLLPIDPVQQNFDGIISRHHQNTDIIEKLKVMNLPTVDLYYDAKGVMQIPRVVHDELGIGEMGARHLIDKGYKQLAYVKFHDTPGDLGRMQGFCAVCEKEKVDYKVIDAKDFADKIQQEKYPIGVMTGDDTRAIYLCGVCEELGLSIPEQIGLLGADNDSTELCHIPLSSVDNDVEGIGYYAAKLLDKMMHGEKIQPKMIRYAPKRVVERRSTNLLGISDMTVAKAVRLMQENLSIPLSMEKLADEIGLSRRRLDQLFNENLGHSASKHLFQMRMDKACRLLRKSEKPVTLIAKTCGFGVAENMIRIFKREKGMTPGSFRRDK